MQLKVHATTVLCVRGEEKVAMASDGQVTLADTIMKHGGRKVRRLREVHPEVRCKVFYQRDYLHLLLKYGLEEVSGELPPPTRLPGPPQVTDLGERRGVG